MRLARAGPPGRAPGRRVLQRTRHARTARPALIARHIRATRRVSRARHAARARARALLLGAGHRPGSRPGPRHDGRPR
ncbi:hypothetical protein [Streptomyces sp. NPDC058674]|uniref:hypothetical protein n=1 Tax=Streptomyces sp. NPDC058674 TaxID=3346592 RepID=UPI00364F56CB